MKHFIWITILLALGSCTKNIDSDCNNGLKDGTETGVDCGGICVPCPSCSDGIKNQDEVKVDCGGICEPCPIEYPAYGTFGLNVLHGDEHLYLPGTGNSFRAIIPEGSSLKIELYSLAGGVWGYSAGNHVGWIISPFKDDFQSFEALNPGVAELNIVRWSGDADILIKYFENDSIETKRKILTWQ